MPTLLIALSLVLCAASAAQAKLQTVVFPETDKQYIYNSSAYMSLEDGSIYCLSLGGSLVKLKSQMEHDFVTDALSRMDDPPGHFWLGAQPVYGGNGYSDATRWDDGTNITWSNYYTGRRSSESLRCGGTLVYPRDSNFQRLWGQWQCHTKWRVVCERPVDTDFYVKQITDAVDSVAGDYAARQAALEGRIAQLAKEKDESEKRNAEQAKLFHQRMVKLKNAIVRGVNKLQG